MDWTVAKSGEDSFDALHAYGLAVVLACVSQAPVELEDEGLVYGLHGPTRTLPHVEADILDEVLALPDAVHIEALDEGSTPKGVQVANLDGLLAALFTTVGVRVNSVADLLYKCRQRPPLIQESLKKASAAIARARKYAARASRPEPGWLAGALQDYNPENPGIPTIAPKVHSTGDMGLLMTMSPAFSYSTRQPASDGLISHKVQVQMRGTRYAVLFALIGAARFLRAQRVAGHRVNFYVPLAACMNLSGDSALPLMRSKAQCGPAQAVVLQALRLSRDDRSTAAHATPKAGLRPGGPAAWQGLAYQVLQTQGAQQSISVDRGCVDLAWFATIRARAGDAVLDYWKRVLSGYREQSPYELDNLIDCLVGRSAAAWQAHLREVAIGLSAGSEAGIHSYSLRAIKEVTSAMADAGSQVPLSKVLERKEGTLRFGHALRQLGRHNPSALRDVLHELDTVRSRDQLIRALAYAAQEFSLADAKYKFAILPSDQDLQYLLDDVERYGEQTIAGLLLLLSALHYSRQIEKTNAADGSASAEAAFQREGDDNGSGP